MTGLLPCTCAGTCQADRTCQLPSRFQAQLDAPPRAQRPSVHRRTEACAGHFGALAAAVATWARDDDLAEGDLTILAIDPAPAAAPPGQQLPPGQARGLIVSTIHLSGPPGSPAPRHTRPPPHGARPPAAGPAAAPATGMRQGALPPGSGCRPPGGAHPATGSPGQGG